MNDSNLTRGVGEGTDAAPNPYFPAGDQPESTHSGETAHDFEGIIGISPALRASLRQLQAVAPTPATVLLVGETGTGKEMFAQALHSLSSRSDQPLVRVNCAALPHGLMESEFFGHLKGSFTGAVQDRPGRFAAANRGTLFLDEVGEIPVELQSKLLRVLEEKEYERIGDDRTRAADVRIVAATNRNLPREVEAGRFREDLFYRLNVFPIDIPPLRERDEDIRLLAQHFLALSTQKLGRPARLAEAELSKLQQYDWPGNVRELHNVIERAVISSRGGQLRLDLPGPDLQIAHATPSSGNGATTQILTDAAFRHLERSNLLAALDRADWRIYGSNGAAQLLGLKPTTLSSRIQRLGLKRLIPH